MIHDLLHFFKRFCKYALSQFLYSWRFRSFGTISIVGPFVKLDNPRFISIGSGVRILANARLECINSWQKQKFTPVVVINDRVNIGHNFFLSCASRVEVGEGCLISDSVALIDNSHLKTTRKSPSSENISSSPICIGKNVTIYRLATILEGVTIGDDAVIAAYSLVTESVPSGCLVAGIPAKIIKRLQLND